MRRIYVGLFLLCSGYTFAQNLVPNPSFETLTANPSAFGQITNATPWYSAYGTADLFHTSGSPSNIGIPTNYFGSQAAHTGSAYAGIASSQTNLYHEFMAAPLSSPLVAGQSYYCEAYVSAGEGGYRLGINNFGFKFSSGILMGSAGDPPISGGADVNWASTIMDYTNWVQISGTFTASANSTHLTIGNFYSMAATIWTPLGTSGSINSQYWFIDDVVVQISTTLAMPPHSFTARTQGTNTVALDWEFPEMEDVKEFSLQRSIDGGNTWFRVARIPASERVATYSHLDRPNIWGQDVLYTLRKTSHDGSVSLSDPVKVNLPFASLDASMSIGPHPLQAGSPCNVALAAREGEGVQWALFDLNGKLVMSGEQVADAGQAQFTLETSNLIQGTYLLKVSTATQSATRKLVLI